MSQVYSDVDIEEFYGDVLYLGMGSLWIPRQQTDKVTSTTIIENDLNIVNEFSNNLKSEWNLIIADAWEYTPTQKFDVIYADIWHRIIDYQDVQDMFCRYKKYLKTNGQMRCLERLVRKTSIPLGKKLIFINT